MKILYVANRAEIFSGGQISLLELISGLDRSRFQPVVLCPGEGGLAEKIRDLGITVRIWDMPSIKTFKVMNVYEKVQELKRIIAECDADIVHTNGSRAQAYAALAVGRSKSHLVWHVREAVRDFFLYDAFLALSAEKVICVSGGVKKERFGLYPGVSKKMKVIYNGVDTKKFKKNDDDRFRIREEFRVGADNILLGILGPLVVRKGHSVLVKALKNIEKDHPAFKLLVLGRTVHEEYAADLRKMVKDMDLGQKVVFVPARDDVVAILSALDIFVLPSQSEGFSRVLLEAMSCGLPTITTDVAGNNEAVVSGESGILTPYGDPNVLAQAITRLIEGKSLADNMGRNAQNRVKECFSIEKHVQDIQKMYEELMG